MPFNVVNESGQIVYGLTPYDEETLFKKLNDAAIANIKAVDPDAVVDTSDTSVVGRFNKAISSRLSDAWSELKQIENALYPSKTFGHSLDKLVLQVGFLRNGAKRSIGELRFFGDDGTIVPAETTYASLRGDEFFNPDPITISLSSCLSFRITVGYPKAGRDYSVSINTLTYTVSSADANHYNILQQLATELSAESLVSVTASADLGEDSYLDITKVDDTSPMECFVSPLLLPSLVQVEGTVVSQEGGEIFGDADTIVEIVNSVEGLDAVNNPKDFILGSNLETDAELLERATTDFRSVGSGSKSTIEARISQLEDVRGVYVEENRTFETNVNGIPQKAYEVVVSHDTTEQIIAQLIWETKPAGIQTYGQTSQIIKDASGNDQEVFYTNATEKYAYVKVEYTLLETSEGEDFPADGDLLIAKAIAAQGLGFNINEDIIGKRFYRSVYDVVDRVDELDIQVYVSNDPNEDINTIVGWSDRISIGRTEISTFAVDRVLVTDVTP